MTSGLAGDGFLGQKLNTVHHELLYLGRISGMLNFLGENPTVSDIRSALVLGMYVLCNM